MDTTQQTKKMTNTDSIVASKTKQQAKKMSKLWGLTEMLANGKPILFLMRHPSYYGHSQVR